MPVTDCAIQEGTSRGLPSSNRLELHYYARVLPLNADTSRETDHGQKPKRSVRSKRRKFSDEFDREPMSGALAIA